MRNFLGLGSTTHLISSIPISKTMIMKKIVLTLFAILIKTELFAVQFVNNGIHYNIPDPSKKECWLIKDTENNGVVTSSNYSGMIVIPSQVEYEGEKYDVTKLDRYAFYGSKISFISLPNSIREIDINAFSNSVSLEKVVLPNELEIIPKYCFSGCDNLKSIEIPDHISKIDEGAFQYSGLESVQLPSSILFVGDYAFADSKGLKSIRISDSQVYWGKAVLRDCPKLESIEMQDTHPTLALYNEMLLSKDYKTIFFCPQSVKGEIKLHEKVKVIENSAFYGCSQISSVKFNENIDSIQPLSFYGCSQLTELQFPKGLKYIGDCAFERCSSVTNIDIPNSVKELGFGCFYYTAISDITIPASVEVLGSKVFYTCENLYKANVRGIIPPKRDSYLFPLRRNMEIHVLKGLKSLYSTTEYWNEYVTIYDDLEWIMATSIIMPQEEYTCGINEMKQAVAIILPENADAQTPVWSSSDESVVYIDKTGSFIGLKEGTANIIATASDGSGVYSTAIVHVQNGSSIGTLTGNSQIYETARFSLNGVRLSKPTKGINIIVLNNGVIRKEIVR